MGKRTKKAMAMAVTAAVSGVVLVTSAFAASVNVSGYEKLKAAAFNILEMKNYTAVADVSIEFDGKVVLSGEAVTKQQDRLNNSTISTMTHSGEAENSENYLIDGTSVFYSRGNDGYYVYPQLYGSSDNVLVMTDNQKKFANIVLDLFAGDTKNYFTNSNGNITARLERSQIPEVVQAGVSVMTELANREMGDAYIYLDETSDFDAQIASMLNGMVIDYVYVNADVDDNNTLTRGEFATGISGSDANGTPHTMTISVSCALSDIGTTVADKIDLESVNVISTSDRVYRFESNGVSVQTSVVVGKDGEIIVNTEDAKAIIDENGEIKITAGTEDTETENETDAEDEE